MVRRLLKQRYMASLHGREGHSYRVYLSRQTVENLQAIYETYTHVYADDLRVQDIAYLLLEDAAAGEALYLRSQVDPRLIGDAAHEQEPG